MSHDFELTPGANLLSSRDNTPTYGTERNGDLNGDASKLPFTSTTTRKGIGFMESKHPNLYMFWKCLLALIQFSLFAAGFGFGISRLVNANETFEGAGSPWTLPYHIFQSLDDAGTTSAIFLFGGIVSLIYFLDNVTRGQYDPVLGILSLLPSISVEEVEKRETDDDEKGSTSQEAERDSSASEARVSTSEKHTILIDDTPLYARTYFKMLLKFKREKPEWFSSIPIVSQLVDFFMYIYIFVTSIMLHFWSLPLYRFHNIALKQTCSHSPSASKKKVLVIEKYAPYFQLDLFNPEPQNTHSSCDGPATEYGSNDDDDESDPHDLAMFLVTCGGVPMAQSFQHRPQTIAFLFFPLIIMIFLGTSAFCDSLTSTTFYSKSYDVGYCFNTSSNDPDAHPIPRNSTLEKHSPSVYYRCFEVSDSSYRTTIGIAVTTSWALFKIGITAYGWIFGVAKALHELSIRRRHERSHSDKNTYVDMPYHIFLIITRFLWVAIMSVLVGTIFRSRQLDSSHIISIRYLELKLSREAILTTLLYTFALLPLLSILSLLCPVPNIGTLDRSKGYYGMKGSMVRSIWFLLLAGTAVLVPFSVSCFVREYFS